MAVRRMRAAKRFAPAKRKYPEQDLQMQCVSWLTLMQKKHGIRFASTPNEARRSPRLGAKLKKMGMSPGFPDLMVFLPGSALCPMGDVIYVEFKAPGHNGRLIGEQYVWQGWLEKNKFVHFVCTGFDAFKSAITDAVNRI